MLRGYGSEGFMVGGFGVCSLRQGSLGLNINRVHDSGPSDSCRWLCESYLICHDYGDSWQYCRHCISTLLQLLLLLSLSSWYSCQQYNLSQPCHCQCQCLQCHCRYHGVPELCRHLITTITITIIIFIFI